MVCLVSIGQQNPLPDVGLVTLTICHCFDDSDKVVLALKEAIDV